MGGARFAGLLARLFCGAAMLRSGWSKLRGGFGPNEGAREFIQRNLAQGRTFGWFRGVAEHQLLPHAKVLSYLVVAGELTVGTCLLLGLFTRWASVIGIVMMLAFGLTGGAGLGPEVTYAFALLFLTIATTGAGRLAGLDSWLSQRAPGWLV
jgi:thiosulfate dehydrogenase [quinone] large subunit